MIGRIGNRLISSLAARERPYKVQDSDLKRFFLRVQPSGVMIYGVDVDLPDGRRSTRTIGRHGVFTPAQAREEAKKILGDIAKGIDPLAVRKSQAGTTLRTFIEVEYLPWLAASRKDGSPAQNAKADIRAEANVEIVRKSFPTLLDTPMTKLSSFALERWKAVSLDSGLKRSSVNRKLDALRAALSRAVEWGHLAENPCKRVKWCRLDTCPKVRFLSEEEAHDLEQALINRDNAIRMARTSANQWRKARGQPELPSFEGLTFVDHLTPIVRLARNLGLRRGELLSLCQDDVDLKNRVVTVAAHSAKSGKTRHVPLNRTAFETLSVWIREQRKNTNHIFSGKDGGRVNNFEKSWRGVLTEAKIEGFRFHDLRHDFASRLVMNGVDLNTVRELLGHSDLSMTLRYAHLAPRIKAAAVAMLDTVILSPAVQAVGTGA